MNIVSMVFALAALACPVAMSAQTLDLNFEEASPAGFLYPEVELAIGGPNSPPVLEVSFELTYDSLWDPTSFSCEGTWFNPDGRVEVQIKDFGSENRRRVRLRRSDGIPQSGVGPIYRDPGLGIIDVAEIKRECLKTLELRFQALPRLYYHCQEKVHYLQLPGPASSLEVFDASGNRLWKRTNLPQGTHPLPSSTLPPGIYFVVVAGKDGRQVEKMLVF